MMNLWISQANSAGARWSAWMLAGLMDAAVLLALIGVTWRLIRHRVAPQVGYCLFLLVPIKLVVPAAITLPAAWIPWTPSALVAGWLQPARSNDPVQPRTPLAFGPVALLEDKRPDKQPDVAPIAASRAAILTDETSTSRSNGGVVREGWSGSQRLSMPAMMMLVWLATVVLLLGRWIVNHARFRSRLGRMTLAPGPGLAVARDEVCRLARVSSEVRIVEDDSIASPVVSGILRPIIVIPRAIESSLSTVQLRWVLLHELAHVRRCDLFVAGLQRLVTILHFFNPAAWLANRMIDRLREYACDDLATTLSRSSAIESGEAFLNILRHVDRSRRLAESTLGLFGFDSRAACLSRIQRLLDADRPIQTSPRAWPIYGLILLTLFSLPSLRASGETPITPSQDPIQPVIPKAEVGQREFELHVVGPDGKPVPGAIVRFRTDQPPTSQQFRRGKFVSKSSYGVTARADEQGVLIIDLAIAGSRDLNLYITTPGFGPYWAGWSSRTHPETIPSRFTAELEAGWTAAGLVVDEQGQPIAGATVQPHIEFKKRPGELQQLGSGTTLRTDKAGRWRFDSVPESLGMVYATINHPDFKSIQRPVARGEFGVDAGRESTGKIVLSRGLTIVGKVTDEVGQPISGASIRSKFMNDIREAKTGDDGTYRLVGCDASQARVVVSAPGRATDMVERNIEPGMSPLDFQMKPGKTVRVRVLDDQGQPFAGARIFFQRWRGMFQYFEFDHISQYTGRDGTWVWNEAPVDGFSADICPPGRDGMQLVLQSLQAREEEYVFRLPPTLVVTGKVIDAVTKQPIPEFQVVPGGRSIDNSLYWNQREGFNVTDGRYEIRQSRTDGPILIRVAAAGYEASISREIKPTEGRVTVDFEVKPGKSIVGMVLTPGLKPAQGAVVALGIAGSQIHIKNGDFDNSFTTAERATVDSEGRFHFAAQFKDFVLFIIHPSGYAEIPGSPDWETMKLLRLKPWARVEGTFRIGSKPTTDVPLGLSRSGEDRDGQTGPRIWTTHETTTGVDGKYVFDRVIPGSGRIGLELFLNSMTGAADVTSSCKVPIEFPAGQTTRLDLGGSGRAVVGKLLLPEGGVNPFRWNFVLVNLAPEAAGPYYTATINRDGSFRIDDVTEGRYTLTANFMNGIGGSLAHQPLEVSPIEAGHEPKPLDLGTLKLPAKGR